MNGWGLIISFKATQKWYLLHLLPSSLPLAGLFLTHFSLLLTVVQCFAPNLSPRPHYHGRRAQPYPVVSRGLALYRSSAILCQPGAPARNAEGDNNKSWWVKMLFLCSVCNMVENIYCWAILPAWDTDPVIFVVSLQVNSSMGGRWMLIKLMNQQLSQHQQERKKISSQYLPQQPLAL